MPPRVLTSEEQRVLNESTTAAQNAARAIGGTFQQGTFNPSGQFTGGFVPGQLTPIRTDTLTGSIPSPYILPSPASNEATGFYSYLDTFNDPTLRKASETANALVPDDQNKRATAAELERGFLDRLLGRKGQTELTSEAYAAEVDPAKKELDDIQSQIRTKTLAYRREIENARKIEGITTGGADAIVADIQRKANSELADLSVIEQAKLGNYSTAKEIADRAVAAKLEKQNNELEIFKYFSEKYGNDLKEKDQQRLNVIINERTRLLNQEDTKLKTIQDLAIEAAKNGAPGNIASQIQKATSIDQALGIASQYLNTPSTEIVKLANGSTILVDKRTGRVIKNFDGSASGTSSESQLARNESNIADVDGLVNDSYLNTAVGPNSFARVSFSDKFTGGKSNFIAGVEQLRSRLNLDTLISAKGSGATFGALSDAELKLLASAASKIGTWAIKNREGDILGYRVGEKAFKDELTRINNFSKLDYILKGGIPANVNASILPDGTIWTLNNDGTYTQLR